MVTLQIFNIEDGRWTNLATVERADAEAFIQDIAPGLTCDYRILEDTR